jgi:basic amino acid/polyamine antiporter, APA family
MVNTMIGGGIFGLPSVVASRLGSLAPVAYVIAAAGIFVIVACMSEVASQFDRSGGPYIYAREALGRWAGILIAWFMWLSRVAAASGTANLVSAYLGQLAPRATEPAMRAVVLSVLIGVLAVINYCGVRSGTRTSDFFTITKVLLLVLFIAMGFASLLWKPPVPAIVLAHPVRTGDWMEAFLLLVFAYGGFEAALFASGEARNMRRDAPVALFLGLGLVTVIYTSVQIVVNLTLANPGATERPLAEAARQVFGKGAGAFIVVGALVTIYGYLSANMLHTPRLTYAMAAEGDFPKIFAALHPRFRTPYVSIGLYSVALLSFTLIGNFRWNLILSSVTRLFVYGSVAIVLVVLRWRRPEADSFRMPGGMIFAALGVLLSIVLLVRMPLSNVWVVGITIGVATLNWLLVRTRQPREINGV